MEVETYISITDPNQKVEKSTKRKDDRLSNQIRQMESEQSLLDKADGSAKFSQDKSTVIVAVYGPMEVKSRKENIEKAAIEVVWKPKSGLPGMKETEYEFYLRSTLESVVLAALHPRTSISVIVQVLSEDGSLLSTAINATCLALLDAGISLKGLIGSVTCAYSATGTLLLDPDAKEEQESENTYFFAFDSNSDGVVTSRTTGTFDEEQYFSCLKSSKKATEAVFSYIRKASEQKYKNFL